MADHHLLIEPVQSQNDKQCRVSLSDDTSCFSLWVDEDQLRKVLTRLDCSDHVIARFLSSPYIVKQQIPALAAREIGHDIFN
jgi:hypothetical protein